MRTFTVVPSFEGDSAFFELPDIGFQGDHLSFAILFNLTELTEHWPNILPSMIITDSEGSTYIAPHTHWDADEHIFTWLISSIETTHDGALKCQLKCSSADDPDVIICMSQICQTRVYPSLVAAEDPPEAFQSWLDTLAQLGAQIEADASAVLESVETTETNARTAQAAAEAAELAKNAAQAARNSVENTAQIAVSAAEEANQAQQQAARSAAAALDAKNAIDATKEEIDAALGEADRAVASAQNASQSAQDAAEQAAISMSVANTARQDAVSARDATLTARDQAVTAKNAAEAAQSAAENAQSAAETAQSSAENAQAASEAAQAAAEAAEQNAAASASSASDDAARAEAARDRAETARNGVENYADKARRWAEGKDSQGNDVVEGDETFENSAKYWAAKSEQNSEIMYGYMADIQANVGIVKKIQLEIAVSDWVGGASGKYPYYVDIEDEGIQNTQLPLIALEESSLVIAANSLVCPSIKSYNGFVRIRSEELPEDTIRGMLYMFGDGLSGEFVPPATDDIGIATDEDVADMIIDVFGEQEEP